MKINKTIGALALGLGFAFVAQAQPTNTFGTAIYMTGSTAFRAQIFNALGDLGLAHNAGDSGGNNTFTYSGNVADATTGAVLNLGVNAPGLVGTPVTVYCSWSGSVEGLDAIIPPFTTASYENVANPVTTFNYTGADIAMSDVGQSSTIASPNITGVTLQEAQLAADANAHGKVPDTGVAVVAFAMVGNNAATSKISNITYQNMTSMFEGGTLPLCFFTGVAGDAGTPVYAVGRYNLSGTRATFVLDNGMKYNQTLKQYALTTDGGVTTPGLASTDTASPPNAAGMTWFGVGNNGYFTGGNVGKAIDFSSQQGLPPAIAYIGWPDATSKLSAAHGDGPLTFNGQNPGTLAAWNTAGVENGSYTFWGYERMYVTPGDNGGFDQTTFAPGLIAAIQYEIQNPPAGTPVTAVLESQMNVYRNADGGLVFHF